MTRRQYQEFQKAQQQEIHRVKMYKAKKQWMTAGITAFSLAIGLAAMSTTSAHAATAWTARSTTEIQASLKSEGTEPYMINYGDTLSTIADAANKNGIETSVTRLAQINKIANIDLIIAGNKLWFNGAGTNGTVTVEDKNGASHTYNLSPNKPIQSGNNGNGTAVDTTTGGVQSNTNNGSTTTNNNGSGSSSNNNNSGSSNVNNGSNNGTGNTNNGNNSNNNGSNGNNNNGSGNNSNNNNGGTTDPTTPTTPSENQVSYKINFVDYTNNNKVLKSIELKGKIGETVKYTSDTEITIDGKKYVLSGSAEINKTITLNEDANKNVITVGYRPNTLPESSSYVVNYVDESGKPIAKSKKVDNVKMMSDIVEYAPVIDGYTVKNSNVINAVLSEENQVLTFVYSKNSAPVEKTTVNIHSVDQDGKSIAEVKKVEGNVGDIFTASAENIDGYTLTGDATQSIKLSKSGNNITFHYTKAVAPVEKTSYTVSYQTADGTKLQADKVVNDQEVGKQVTETAHTIKGYKLTSQATQTMTLAKSGNHITFTYAKEEAPVAKTTYTVSYQAEDGTKLQADKTVKDQVVGASVSETAPAIAGYTVKGNATQTMTLAKDNNHITFTYSKNADPIVKADITVKSVDEQGNVLATETVKDQEVGKNYTATAKAINGYTLKDSATKTIKVAKDNNVITFTYAKAEAPVEKTSYTVSYQAEDGTKLQADKTVNDQKVGTAVTETAPTIDGYTIKGNATQSLTLAKDNNHITFTYTKNAETGVDAQAIANKLTQLVNAERQRVGVAPLQTNSILVKVANVRAQELSENFEHGNRASELAEQFGYKNVVAENGVYDTLGIGETADEMAQDLFDGLKEDYGHYHTMIAPDLVEEGVGVTITESNQVFASQIYGMNEASAPDPVETATATANYVDESGKVIASQDTKTGNVGDAFSFTAKTIAGYKLVSQATQNGTFTKGGSSVTFTYKADAPVTGDHSTPVNAPAGTAGLLDGNTTPAGNTHNLWFYMDKQTAPAGQTKSNLIFATMQDATNFAENYLDSTMLEPNPLFNGYAVNQVMGDGTTAVGYTIYWR